MWNTALALSLLLPAPTAVQDAPCADLDAAEAGLAGVVRDQETAVWLPGARVIATWADGRAQTVAGQGGVYTLCPLPAGIPIDVHVALPPTRGATVRLVLAPQEVRSLDPVIDVTMLAAGRGGVVGAVLDAETREPVESALVGIEGTGFQALTNEDGRFSMLEIPAGTVTLSLQHIAYGEQAAELEVPTGATVEVEVQVTATPLPLEPIRVNVKGRRSLRLEHAGFYRRREWMEKVGLGEFVTRDDIERRQAVRLSQVLADLPRMDFRPFCPGWRCLVPIIRGRSPACRRVKREGLQAFIGPSIYLNGRRVPMVVGGGLFGIDDLTNPSDIAGIEVYTGIGDLPADFADFNAQRCGAIAIWTGN